MSNIPAIPEDYQTVTPYLTVNDAAAALVFYEKAFGAMEILRLKMPDGKVGHAEFKIGQSIFMISDEYPDSSSKSPLSLDGSSVKLHVYVNDVDASYAQAIAAGATVIMPPANQFWGDRMGSLTDPFGHHWLLATHIEDVEPGEFQGRMEAFFATNQGCGGS